MATPAGNETSIVRAPSGGDEWTFTDKLSLGATLGLVVLCVVVAWLSYSGAPFFLALSLGALGGLIHELAQSYGTVFFFKKYKDGLYLGTVSSMILGGVAGALVVQGQLMLPAGTPGLSNTAIAYAAFLAGLALKGVTEASTGSEVKDTVDDAVRAGGAAISGATRDVGDAISKVPKKP